jgi:hypothetical protein
MSNARQDALAAVIARFDESCAVFARLVANADEAADAMDFTGKLHDLSLAAGRVQGLGDALALYTGDAVWGARADATLREYLGASTLPEGNGHGQQAGQHELGGLD